MKRPFPDRRAAGEILAGKLLKFTGRPDVVVLGLPRGGVPVAQAVAHSLDLPLDILVVRKLGVPGQEEVAFGAIAGDGVQVLNPAIVAACGLDGEAIGRAVAREQRELARRELAYRDGRPPLQVKHRTVILVDRRHRPRGDLAAAKARRRPARGRRPGHRARGPRRAGPRGGRGGRGLRPGGLPRRGRMV
jgi:putative phosphoribosyl transferase